MGQVINLPVDDAGQVENLPHTRKAVELIPVVFAAIILLLLLLAVSLPQLVWTLRVVQRVRAWMDSERNGIELVPFASASRWAAWSWFIGVVLSLVVVTEANIRNDVNMIAMCAVISLWCLLQLIVSWLSCNVCREVSRFSTMRQLGEQGLADAALLFPEGFGKPITASSLKLRVNTLSRVSLAWLIFLSAWAVVGLLALLAHGLGSVSSSAGQLLLLFAAFVLPGLIALFVMRYVVESRAQRAHFLWFLAMTTQKQRPMATELMAWGRSHPGRFGSQVLEVARDIGVGESLSEALAAQRGLLHPSDLMSVRVAEQTGTLAETLRDCAVRQTQSLKGDSVVGNASGTGVWLWAVVVVAATVVSFVMYYIIPKFKAIFYGFGTELPWVTVSLINLADLCVDWMPLLLPSFVMLSVVLLRSCGEAYLRGWSETWLAWKLGFGRQAEVPRLLRRLRGAVVAKMPWPTALLPMVLKHPQDDIRSRLERVLGRITAGMEVWPALRDAGLLNARDVSLLEMAERANNLEWALAALAESKERSLLHRWQMAQTLSVPVFTVAAGVLVMLICVAFFLPLVKLLNDLS